MPVNRKHRIAVTGPADPVLLRELGEDGRGRTVTCTFAQLAAVLGATGSKAVDGVVIFAAPDDTGNAGKAIRLCRRLAPHLPVVAVFPTQAIHARQMLVRADEPERFRPLYGVGARPIAQAMQGLLGFQKAAA